MSVKTLAVLAAIGALALPAFAGASAQLTARDIRIGDHPAFVRVVVDFGGGTISAADVHDGWPQNVFVWRPGATSVSTWSRPAYGVRARVVRVKRHLRVDTTETRFFKYLSYAIVGGNRLAIDLWKGAPAADMTEIRRGAGGCLSLGQWHVARGRVTVSGRERGLFEHTFRVDVWGAQGRELAEQTVTKRGGWSTTVPFHTTHAQAGVLEAVALSPKDGALTCIAQVRARLPAS